MIKEKQGIFYIFRCTSDCNMKKGSSVTMVTCRKKNPPKGRPQQLLFSVHKNILSPAVFSFSFSCICTFHSHRSHRSHFQQKLTDIDQELFFFFWTFTKNVHLLDTNVIPVSCYCWQSGKELLISILSRKASVDDTSSFVLTAVWTFRGALLQHKFKLLIKTGQVKQSVL